MGTMTEEDRKNYIKDMDLAFYTRLKAQCGDGILVGLGEKSENTVVECNYRGEKHYFIFSSETHYLLPASKVNEPPMSSLVAFDYRDPSALKTLQELLVNPWVKPDFDIGKYI